MIEDLPRLQALSLFDADYLHPSGPDSSSLRTMIRRSAETPRSLEDYVAHLDDRVDAVSRAQSMADDYGAIDLHRLLADELLRYTSRKATV